MQCYWKNESSNTTNKKRHHDTHGSWATLFSPSLATSWAIFWMILRGHRTLRSHRNSQWLRLREMFHMISFLTGHAFLPNTLISGIFLAYLLNLFHGRWIVCTFPLSPLSPFFTTDTPAFSGLTWYNACFLFMLNDKPVREKQVPHDSTNEQNTNRHIETDNCQRVWGLGSWVKKVKGLSTPSPPPNKTKQNTLIDTDNCMVLTRTKAGGVIE